MHACMHAYCVFVCILYGCAMMLPQACLAATAAIANYAGNCFSENAHFCSSVIDINFCSLRLCFVHGYAPAHTRIPKFRFGPGAPEPQQMNLLLVRTMQSSFLWVWKGLVTKTRAAQWPILDSFERRETKRAQCGGAQMGSKNLI
jgi:hypothetical protein